MRAVILILLVGCYAPHPQAGVSCASTGACPYGLVCSAATQTCELTDHDGGIDVQLDTPSGVAPDACVPMPEICGDGIDQDCNGVDPPCPANDLPSGAIDVTAGGTFTVDLSAAHDDAAPNGSNVCGGTGGRDVFYDVTIAADEVYYLDTFGSDFDSVIRVFHGACVGGVAPMGTMCHDDECGVTQTQFSGVFHAGTTCIVIDQKNSSVTAGDLVLHVERGYRSGTKLTSTTLTDNTCTDGNADAIGTCSGAAQDIGYYTTECPNSTGSLTATTCNAATLYDSALLVLGPGTTQLACDVGDLTCVPLMGSTVTNVQLPGAHLFWLIVTGKLATDCGAYSLTTTLN